MKYTQQDLVNELLLLKIVVVKSNIRNNYCVKALRYAGVLFCVLALIPILTIYQVVDFLQKYLFIFINYFLKK